MEDVKNFVYQKLRSRSKAKFDDTTNVYKMGIDSLELVVLVSEIEAERKIKITDEALAKIETVADVVAAVSSAS